MLIGLILNRVIQLEQIIKNMIKWTWIYQVNV